jgi:crotonobetainyl-CoA:carnitine CoA-transferase CaiB-like acyl-CoA transferase
MSLLKELSVIEIPGKGSAAWAAKHFADWGAIVTLLEPRNGTPLRNTPPFYEVGGRQRSAMWEWLSRGKVGLAGLSLEQARDACSSADVVLIDSDMADSVLGVEPKDVRSAFERRTTCVLISPFATDGPYANYETTDLGIAALGGWMGQIGDRDREPIAPGRAIPYRVAGIFAFVAALISLRCTRQGGAPQFIDLSLQAVAASMISSPWMIKSMLGVNQERHGNAWPLGVMECADGFVGAPPLTAAHWEMLCRMVGLEEVLEDPESADPAYRMIHGPALYERIKPELAARTRQGIFEEAQAWRIPAAPVQSIKERLACPQLKAREFWSSIQIDQTSVRVPRVPYRINGAQPVERGAFVSPAGTPRESSARQSEVADGGLLLSGIRVIDLTAFWSGPYATSLLGALGADVIKVESLRRPDTYRFQLANPALERWWEWGPVWNDSNCNKRGVTLDLSSATGRGLFERLLEASDVVVSNFSNRVMPNLGLSSEQLMEINPRLVAVTMPGYGTGGPWENYVGYAIAFEQLICGWMTGYADGAPSYAAGFCDPTVGMHVVAAVELALLQRERTGQGAIVEVPQCEILDSLFAPEQIAVQLGAAAPSRRGNKHEWMAPHGAYRTAGNDAWITLAVSSDSEFARLVRELGNPDLAKDERFASVAARKEHEVELDRLISELVKTDAPAELERRLQEVGVAACRVVKGYELTEDPGMQHLAFFRWVDRSVTGKHPYKAWPFSFSSVDVSVKRPPPTLGQDNHNVLTEVLGLSRDEVDALEQQGAIGTTPANV